MKKKHTVRETKDTQW